MCYYGIWLWSSAKPLNTKTLNNTSIPIYNIDWYARIDSIIYLRLLSNALLFIINDSLLISTLNNLTTLTYKNKQNLQYLLLQILISLKFHPKKFQVIHPGVLKRTGVDTYSLLKNTFYWVAQLGDFLLSPIKSRKICLLLYTM